MPTYEYRCTRCRHQFDAVHAVGESVDRCERCGAPVRRVFSAPALIFKGSGFHINDYRKTPPPPDGEGKAAGPAKTTETKTETKTETNTKTKTKKSDSRGKDTAVSSSSDAKKAS